MFPGPVDISSRKRIAIAQLHRLVIEILHTVADECDAEIVAEARTCNEALRLIQDGLAVDLVIAPLLSLASAETEAELRRVGQDVSILAMASSRRGVAVYELRRLSADVGLGGMAQAVRTLLNHARG